MSDWKDRKAQTDKLLPVVKRILGEHLISAAPIEEDAERNTDLIVLRLEAVRIGVRIRNRSYWPAYHHEFTIRAGLPSGAKTELTKIVEGWGDYFFYGFANEDYTDLIGWMLGDLRVFRLWFNRQLCTLNAGQTPGTRKENKDGSSDFLAFKIDELPTGFVIARNSAAN